MTLKETALTHIHRQAGARMAPFAGFDMPIQYRGIYLEHTAVRETAGLFDVSHMGQLHISGPHALDLVQWVTTNDAAKLRPGQAQYSCLPNRSGGIVDDILVYCLSQDDYLLVVNAANIQKDLHWIRSENKFNALVSDISDTLSLLAIQGPKAMDILQSLTAFPLSEIPYYEFRYATLAGIKNVLVSNTGYTGAGGFELYIKNDQASELWFAILKAGALYGLQACGLGARDTLRLEMGYCLYGQDISDETSPIAAGLSWITRFTHPFVNSYQLQNEKRHGTKQKLVGILTEGKHVPRQGYALKDLNGNTIGRVTSGTWSPTLQRGIALAYIDTPYVAEGQNIRIQIRTQDQAATVYRPPFLKLISQQQSSKPEPEPDPHQHV